MRIMSARKDGFDAQEVAGRGPLERQDIIAGLLAALVAREHVLLIGQPGTAKSALVMELARCIVGANYFQWLLTKFSTPEELFGPLS